MIATHGSSPPSTKCSPLPWDHRPRTTKTHACGEETEVGELWMSLHGRIELVTVHFVRQHLLEDG